MLLLSDFDFNIGILIQFLLSVASSLLIYSDLWTTYKKMKKLCEVVHFYQNKNIHLPKSQICGPSGYVLRWWSRLAVLTANWTHNLRLISSVNITKYISIKIYSEFICYCNVCNYTPSILILQTRIDCESNSICLSRLHDRTIAQVSMNFGLEFFWFLRKDIDSLLR